MSQDKIRVLRIIEYIGDREAVENQVTLSLHGEKRITTTNRGVIIIKAATIGTYPEILESESKEVQIEELLNALEANIDQIPIDALSILRKLRPNILVIHKIEPLDKKEIEKILNSPNSQ